MSEVACQVRYAARLPLTIRKWSIFRRSMEVMDTRRRGSYSEHDHVL